MIYLVGIVLQPSNTRLGIYLSGMGCFNAGMDVFQIRRANLRTLERTVGGRPQLAQKMGMSYALLQNYIGKTPTKNIGAKIARRAEEVFQLPHGWMDKEHDGPKAPAAAASAPIGSQDQLLADWAALPEGWRYYLARKAKELRTIADALPDFLRDSLRPIPEEGSYREWERKLAEFVAQRGPAIVTNGHIGEDRRKQDTGPKDGVEQRRREYQNHGLVHSTQVKSHLTHKPQKKTRGAA